jgi:hypothetical protein
MKTPDDLGPSGVFVSLGRETRTYFLPDNRSISDANFEPFLSTLTRR